MTDPFVQTSLQRLQSSLRAAAGVEVTYTHSSQGVTYSVTAIPGRTDIEADQGDGILRTMRLHDFIVEMADMMYEPSEGDRIAWDDRVYEVNNPASDRYAAEVGPYKQTWRIHTVEVYGS